MAIVATWAVVVAIAFGGYCRALDMRVNFLRAESGEFLRAAFAPATDQWAFVQQQVLSAYHGHFIPAALLAEFGACRAFGTAEAAWFWRQMLVLGCLAAATGLYMERLGRPVAGPRLAALGAAGGSCFFLFQPFVVEMATWPFMVAQFAALTFVALAAAALVSFTMTPRPARCWAFVSLAYASMHVSGVGAAVTAAALVTAVAVLVVLRRSRRMQGREIFGCGLSVAASGIALLAHGALMLGGAPRPTAAMPLSLTAVRFAAVLVDSLHASVRALWATGGFPWPRVDVAASEAAYGAGLVAVVGAVLWALARRAVRTGEPRHLTDFATICFPSGAIVAYVAMIVLRLRDQPAPEAVLPYLIGGRYLIFPEFFLVLLAGALWRHAFAPLAAANAVLPWVLTLAAAWGTAVFATREMPRLWPHTQIDVEAGWREIVEAARADVAAGRPVANRSLGHLDVEFSPDLHSARHLLGHDLGLEQPVLVAP